MKLETKTMEDIVIFELYSSLYVLSHSRFNSAVKEFFLEKKTKKVLLDCSKLNYLGSRGLSVFMTAYRLAMAEGILIVFCGVQGPVSYALDITGFSDFLHICQSKEEGIHFLKYS